MHLFGARFGEPWLLITAHAMLGSSQSGALQAAPNHGAGAALQPTVSQLPRRVGSMLTDSIIWLLKFRTMLKHARLAFDFLADCITPLSHAPSACS